MMYAKDRIKVIRELERIETENDVQIEKLESELQQLNQYQDQLIYTLEALKRGITEKDLKEVKIAHCTQCFNFTLCREHHNEGLICDKCREETGQEQEWGDW